ncbi:hypothetical protein D3C71_878930 [compost metagenome]
MSLKRKLAVAAFAVCSSLTAGVVLAHTLPDGPVASPPGYSCSASGGVVTCIKQKSSGSKQ